MANVVCYASDGSILEYYNQWSTNQKLVIKGANTSVAPVFYLSNARYQNALIVTPTISSGNITVSIPDILFQDAYPLIVDADYKDNAIYDFSVRIPVMPKAKPGGYAPDNSGSGSGSSGGQTGTIKIANNLTTSDAQTALSAAQGVVIKSMIDELDMEKVGVADLDRSVKNALTEAKESGDFKGDKGEDGLPGRGITSITRTGGNGSAGTTDTYTIAYSDNTTSTFYVYNGANGVVAGDGSGTSASGENGATFIPFVDSEGNLSWSNNKGLPNPETVNIKGPAGSNGEPGVSPDISVSKIDGGNRITITDKNGTSVVDVMDGTPGTDGGTYIPVRGTDYWTDEDISEIKSYVDDAILGGVW